MISYGVDERLKKFLRSLCSAQNSTETHQTKFKKSELMAGIGRVQSTEKIDCKDGTPAER
uniref:Uncharacterized protein n=1 Tax=Romanomermis culicivorax TaxID=13658 RepID=A0A915K2L1_ROMCU